MAVATVRAVLIASAPVTALVPATRIEPLRRTQSLAVPAISLQRISETPFPHLRSSAGLTINSVQLDIWAIGYTAAKAIADACRSALEAATHEFVGESDGYEPETDPELYRITQTWSVFT